MPFDTAQTDFAPAFAAPTLAALTTAFDAPAPTADEARTDPQAALAFLYLAPQPGPALDALLAA
jgi:hypothetical protein